MQPPHESVRLSDFDGPGGEAPRIATRFAFYGDLARFASSTGSGRHRQTPVQCRRRPGRRHCRGLLVVRRRDLPAAVEWECPSCSAAGSISGWEGTPADLRGIDLGPATGTRIVAVSVPTHAALREIARTDDTLIPLAYRTEVDADGQPILAVTLEESVQYGSALVCHAIMTSSQRRGDLLAVLADTLMKVGGGRLPWSGFIGLDAAGNGSLLGESLELELPDTCDPEFVPARPRPRPRSTKRRTAQPRTYRIKITLRDVKPPIWRRLLVPSDIELPALHELLQTAMGWHDCHLHAFRVRDRLLSPPGDFDPIGEDSRGVPLDEIAPRKGSRVVYEYDFGDGWCHDILVEDVVEDRCTTARCLKGKRRCPPEDCGGPWGYAQLCAVIADPERQGDEEPHCWIPDDFDPEEFDVVETDEMVRSHPV